MASPSFEPSSDPEFLAGLASILAPFHARGASEEEIKDVTQRAEQFWLQSKSTSSQPPAPHVVPPTSETPTSSTTAASADSEPPYPLSFAAIAALITAGEPVPGIRDIPDKLAEGAPSVSTVDVSKVKKPWERERVEEEGAGQV